MNRRDWLKTAGLCLAAACLPKFEWGTMRYGDLLAKVARNETLTPGEAEELRLQSNRLEDAAFRSETLMSPQGSLDPNLFQESMPSGGFSVLPVECASIYGINLTPSSGTYHLIGSTAINANWGKGMAIDASAGNIYIQGIARESVYLFTCHTQLATGIASGAGFGLGWRCDDGSAKYMNHVLPVASSVSAPTLNLTHMRIARSAEQYYYCELVSTAAVGVISYTFTAQRVR